jgi:electron transfer flavoprotein alpha subunit
MDTHKGILVCGEIAEGKLAPITVELLGVGRKLADELGEE